MELLHHPGSLGHRDDPKAKAQRTGHPTRQGARRLRAPQGEFVPPGVHAVRGAGPGEQGENRTAADARARKGEEERKPRRKEMIGQC